MTATIIPLREFQTVQLHGDMLSSTLGEFLWREYGQKGHKLRVEEPGFRNNQQWQLTSLGWVGTIPLTAVFHLHLLPQVPIHNLFRMLEYAYALQSFHLLDGLTTADSLSDFYERLAHILAQRVLQRAKSGLHHTYLQEQKALPFIRGQMQQTWPKPWQTAVPCRTDQFTADISDNQILAYTLRQIALTHICQEDVQTAVRRAYRAVKGAVTEVEVG
jgi:5-methylcytosine-specific restriction enzyme subunit McrC